MSLLTAPVDDLDARLLAAHEAGDKEMLVHLYTEAADTAAEDEAKCFYLVHAFVYALETGHPQEKALQARLAAKGREVPI